jgi:hypothetical protein
MLAQLVDVHCVDKMRLQRELASQGERGALRRREFRPVTVQGGDLFLFQARDRELDLLVAQSVVTVRGP